MNRFCMSMTTSAGGTITSSAVAMTMLHSVWVSQPEIMLLMPITTGYMSALVVTSKGHRYWFQPWMSWITNSAAINVLDKGPGTSLKKRMGPEPSTRAGSTTSSGTVGKNCRNMKVAVTDAISGTVRPAQLSTMPRSDTTL